MRATDGLWYVTIPSASRTVMRSLACATREPKRASLFWRCRFSASAAPSTARETCEASASSEWTSSRCGRLPVTAASTPRGSSRTASGRKQAVPSRSSPSSARTSSGASATRRERVPLRVAGRNELHTFWREQDQAHGGLLAQQRPDGVDGRVANAVAPRRRHQRDARAPQCQLVGGAALLVPDEAGHPRDHE